MPEASAIQYETGGLPPPQTPDIDPAARSFLSGVAGALNVGGNANANPNPNASGAGPAACVCAAFRQYQTNGESTMVAGGLSGGRG